MFGFLRHKSFSALIHAEFRIYIIARFFFIMVLTMQATLISWKVFEITHDPFSIGLIGLVEFVPAVIMAIYSGYIIDKSDKKKLLHLSIAGNLFLTILFTYITSQQASTVFSQQAILITIYIIAFCTGIARAFSGPTSFALVSMLVPKEKIPNAISWHSSSWQIAGVGGPAIGGLLYGAKGITFTFTLMIIMMSIAVIVLFFIGPKPPTAQLKGEPMLKSIREGFKFVWNTKEILGVITLDLFAVFFGGATALLPYFSDVILKTGAQGLGILRAAPGIGAIVVMLVVNFIGMKSNQGKWMLWCVAGFGLTIIIFGLSSWFWISFLALLLSGLLDGISIIVRSTVLQLKTPEEMKGRVSALNSIFIISSNELGAFESGFASRLMGVIPSVVFGGMMTIGVVVFTWFKMPSLRKINY
ncbi:MAG: MFS transporter [Chitinophagia bacterium]|jgi:MFS family permease|nr:MFS transporter [Chitinophagia bacterium]